MATRNYAFLISVSEQFLYRKYCFWSSTWGMVYSTFYPSGLSKWSFFGTLCSFLNSRQIDKIIVSFRFFYFLIFFLFQFSFKTKEKKKTTDTIQTTSCGPTMINHYARKTIPVEVRWKRVLINLNWKLWKLYFFCTIAVTAIGLC